MFQDHCTLLVKTFGSPDLGLEMTIFAQKDVCDTYMPSFAKERMRLVFPASLKSCALPISAKKKAELSKFSKSPFKAFEPHQAFNYDRWVLFPLLALYHI